MFNSISTSTVKEKTPIEGLIAVPLASKAASRRIFENQKLQSIACKVTAITKFSMALALPAYLIYNYNTVILQPSYQCDSFSFDLPLRGGDIIIITAASYVALAFAALAVIRGSKKI